MKKILLLLAVIFSANVFAQVEEATITFKQTFDSPNEEVRSQLSMLGEMKTVTYMKGEKSRTEVSGDMIGKNTTIIDGDSKKMLMLIDNPMAGKMYIKNDIEDKEDEKDDKMKVTKTDDTKEILGYMCTKYTIVSEQGNVTLYATDKIKINASNLKKYEGKITGFPLETEIGINQGGMLIIVKSEASEVNLDKVDESKFNMKVPEGYTETTKDKMGGMMGGM